MAGRLIQIKSDKTRQQSDVINATPARMLAGEKRDGRAKKWQHGEKRKNWKALAIAVVISLMGGCSRRE
ncbi:MAG: hypothetical protein WDM87_03365 [Terracidiphilus sp.]